MNLKTLHNNVYNSYPGRSVWFSHLLNYSFEACELHNILLMVFDYSQGATEREVLEPFLVLP